MPLLTAISIISCIVIAPAAPSPSARLQQQAISNIPSSELSALKDLYLSTNGDNWLWEPIDRAGNHWNFTSLEVDPCRDTWQGVSCTIVSHAYHVSGLALSRYELFGTIPESIGNLTFLNDLDLSENRLHGPLPIYSWSLLQDLQQLNFYRNFLVGPIPPSLGQLSTLQGLDLARNSLNGTAAAVCGLTNLDTLDLTTNMLTGMIPSCVGKFSLLTTLRLNDNLFEGPVISALRNLTRLQILELSDNQLSSSIPLFVCDYPAITGLYLGGNKLTGTLPECLGELPLLQNLDVEKNYFIGTLPTSLALLPILNTLGVDHNRLSGTVPSFALLPRMTEILLYNNQFTGTIPDMFGNMSVLRNFDAGSNYFSGTIPASLGMTPTNFIDVSANLLSGSIPATISRMRELFQLMLQENFLEGSLSGVFNASAQLKIDSVLVQQNQLTGSLPDEMFRLRRLNTFIAIENCFSGTLSEAICKTKKLASLILDGLHSASACRNPLLPALHTYGVSNSFHGTIPPCLLERRFLTSLHLSGNSLTGTLPSDVNVSSQLLDLTVSHNSLTGTVPQALQLHNWRSLDLSYNRLSGSLRSDFASAVGPAKDRPKDAIFNSTGHSIAIQNNRISGISPRSLVHMQNVSALGSNMFSCNVDKSDLPQYDGDVENYQCASDAFDGPYYVFIGLVGLALLALCAYWRYPHIAFATMKTTIRKWSEEVESASRNIAYVNNASEIMCQLAVWCTVAIVAVLVPWYATASHYYGTYAHQYAWVISAAFLAGLPPTIVNLILYCALMVGVLCGAAIIVVGKDTKERHRSSSRSSARLHQLSDAPTLPMWKGFLVYTAFLLFNLVIVVGANAGFVTVALGQSNSAVVLAQIALSVFKLTWNTVCTPFLVYLVKETIAQKSSTASLVTVQVGLGLFNNIVIPCLVVAVLSPSCFNSVFSPPGEITSDFVVQSCYLAIGMSSCSYETLRLTASFSPPFKYDYQCSSSFITYYAPAFVYLGLAAAFGAPVSKVIGMYLLERAASGTRWHRVLAKLVPRILKSPTPGHHVTTGGDQPPSPSVNLAKRLVRRLWERYRPIFDASNFIITLATYLGILLTFGVVFPPLAVVMCVAILSVAWQTKLEVGRYLCNAKSSETLQLAEVLERECHGAVSIKKLRRGLFLIICVCCGFYALFLYDTLGNDKGQHKAAWVFFVMVLFPVILYAVMRFLRVSSKGSAQQLGFSLDQEMLEMRSLESSVKDGSESLESGAYRVSDTRDLGGSGGGETHSPAKAAIDGEKEEEGTYSAIHSAEVA